MPVIVGASAQVGWSPGGGGSATLSVVVPGSSTPLAPTVTGTSGSYAAVVPCTVAGRHLLTWARGADVFVDVLDVWPADPRLLVSVSDVVTQLGATRLDAQLAIAAATWMIEQLVGPVLQAAKTARRARDRDVLVLPHTDVSTVTATLDGEPLALAAADVDVDAGIVYNLPASGVVVVSYQVGSDQVPANLRLAAVKIATHLVQSARVGGTPGARDPMDDMVATPYGFALPRAAWELCAPQMRAGGFA